MQKSAKFSIDYEYKQDTLIFALDTDTNSGQ